MAGVATNAIVATTTIPDATHSASEMPIDTPRPIRPADSAGRPAAALPSVGALVSRRSGAGFGAEPRSF